jgi:plasmid stability protein
MRTTLTIEDDLAHALKERAFRTGMSFKAVVNEALRAGLDAAEAPPNPKRYRLRPVSLGGVRPGVDLDKALRLAETLEDREIGRELEQRK